jgi:FkbM family methyltransferase
MTKIFYYLIKLFDKQTENKIQNKICELLGNRIDLLIDVGFYLGEYYMNLDKKIKIMKVFGFEPNPETFAKVKKKFLKNKKVEILNFALGNISSTKEFNINFEPSSSSFNSIDQSSNYFKKKNRILNIFRFRKTNRSIQVKIKTLEEILVKNNVNEIDLMKIDTEGYEFKILKGLNKLISKVKVIHFEHHYDNMLIKNYKFSDINNFLAVNNFKKVFKVKMKFRKSFEYIYINKNYFN